jgi:hypothetical protein
LKQRHVRMSGTHIAARLDHRVVDVLNLSLTGALLKVDEALAVDSQVMLALARDSVAVTVEARVLRSVQASHTSGWLTAVTFLNPTAETKKAIPQLLSLSSRGR